MCHVHRCGPGDRHDRGTGLMAAYERVLVEIAGGIGTVTLNRPEKLNALDRALCDELREALALLTQSDAVRVIVITGAGRAFCAGADLGVLDRDGSALVAAGKDVALALRAAPQPVLAAVNGPAAGGGANRALELVWSARMVPAGEALAIGLFDDVVPHADLPAAARSLAEQWAGQPPGAVRRAKEALYRSEASSLASMLDLEITQQNELFASPKARQRIAGALPAKRSH